MATGNGHDHDADPADECACGEIVRCPEAHRCKPIGWTQPIDITKYDVEPTTFRYYGFPQPPECNHRWTRAHVFYERNGKRIPMPTNDPLRMCVECGQISTTDYQEPA